MITNTSFIKSLLAVMFAASIVGCATGKQTSLNAQTVSEAQYTVKSGDRLVDISRKITGSSANWQSIASYNGIENPDLLSVGDVIAIPGSLLSDYYPTASTALSTESALENTKSAAVTKHSVPNGSALAIQRPIGVMEEVADDVIVKPVVINRSFTLKPIEAGSVGQTLGYDTVAPQIKVVGTYYPKGIYVEPANYARLMMRVSPGVVLDLEMEVNDWYKVQTDKGIGYIRKTDGALLAN